MQELKVHPDVLYSPYYRAARGVYKTWLKDRNIPTNRAIQAYQRLKGIHGALKYALMRAEGPEHAKLLHDYKLIDAWIEELYQIKSLKNQDQRGGDKNAGSYENQGKPAGTVQCNPG